MHEALAERYREGELKASEARRAVVADLRAAGEQQLADELDAILREDAGAANTAAHTGLAHADRLVEVEGGRITPVLGGRPDKREVKVQFRATLLNGMRALWWLRSGKGPLLGENWSASVDSASERFRRWMQATTAV